MKLSAWWARIWRMGRSRNKSLARETSKSTSCPGVYLPFQLDTNSAGRGHYFNVAGRLKPGIIFAAAKCAVAGQFIKSTLASG